MPTLASWLPDPGILSDLETVTLPRCSLTSHRALDEESNEAGHFFASPNKILLPKTYRSCYRWELLYLFGGEKRLTRAKTHRELDNFTSLYPAPHFTITQQEEKQKYLHCTNSGFSEKKIKKRRMKLVRAEMLEAARVFLPPGVKVTQTAVGGQGEGILMQLNASRVDAQEGPPFARQIQKGGPGSSPCWKPHHSWGGWRCRRQWQH